MKKIVILTLIFISFFLVSCKKKNAGLENSSPVNASSEEILPEEKVEINPEIEKLNRVLLKMTDRCKAAIPNGNPEEFLQDLYKVLEAEKSFPSDDLSLYYLIDKKHFVDSSYVPKRLVKLVKNDDYVINKTTLSLREDVELALRKMAQAAKADGIILDVSSTYRSYETQKNTFNYWVSVDGLEEAERESARPGSSQHQLGVAIDFGSIDDSFALTKQCQWLNENASDFGWSLSFPDGYEDVTGFKWESWHFRYIGVEACKFQEKWFSNVQQFMIEFIDAWKKDGK